MRGLIIVGSCRFDGYGAKANSMSLRSEDSTIPGLAGIHRRGVHDRGGKVAVQLYHAGRYMPKADVPCGKDALSPSATFCLLHPGNRSGDVHVSRFLTCMEDYAAGARRVPWKAGFDAVEISASSGLSAVSSFSRPVTNLRTDEFGGSFENRCRVPAGW